MRKLAWVPAMLSIALVPRAARSTDNFPNAIQRDLGLSYSPPCSACHVGGVTQQGTVNTPFGKAMRARGLVAYDESVLAATLAAMQDARVDSDGDGTADIDELKVGTDPNVSEVPGMGIGPDDPSRVPPEYGCGLGRGDPGRWAWLVLAGILARVARGRSKRNEQRTRK
jgi:hypothetical protein